MAPDHLASSQGDLIQIVQRHFVGPVPLDHDKREPLPLTTETRPHPSEIVRRLNMQIPVGKRPLEGAFARVLGRLDVIDGAILGTPDVRSALAQQASLLILPVQRPFHEAAARIEEASQLGMRPDRLGRREDRRNLLRLHGFDAVTKLFEERLPNLRVSPAVRRPNRVG